MLFWYKEVKVFHVLLLGVTYVGSDLVLIFWLASFF
jgi:hypothetical protein